MTNYELRNFKNGKAFIYQEECIDGSIVIGPRICINTKGEKLFELPHPDMIVNNFEDEDVAIVYYNQKRALLNNKGEFLTDFIYDDISDGSEEGFFEVERDGKHGHIDMQGKEVIPCIYDEGWHFREGVAAECLNGKWGMIDCFNNTVIPFEYEELRYCNSNMISARKNGKCGLINKNNEVIIDFIYDDIINFGTRECLGFPAKKGEYFGIIDRDGNVVEDFIYYEVQLVSDEDGYFGDLITLEKNDKMALYSIKSNKFLTGFDYDYIAYLSDGRFYAERNNKVGYLDTNGIEIVPFEYDINFDEDFNEEVAVVVKDGKYGAIDLYGNVIIPFEYIRLYSCYEGVFYAVKEDNTRGFIDKNNNPTIPFGKFSIMNKCFQDGFTIAFDEELGSVYINKKGEVLEIKV